MTALHTRYRPDDFDLVLGQGHIIPSLSTLIKNKTSQVFLFTGPSGVGKTTLARICASKFGCDSPNIFDVDAATHSGADAMRAIVEMTQHRAFSETGARAIVVDECHSLSKQAWQALLKATEEPPPSAYWFFCTTEPGKVPATIKTRASSFNLKLLGDDAVAKVVVRVANKEKIRLRDDVLDAILSAANGSPRQALTYLAMCEGARNAEEAAETIESAAEAPAAVELCRLLATGQSTWAQAMTLLGDLALLNPESVRILVCNYFAKAILSTKKQAAAVGFLHVLDCFSQPYNQSEGAAPLLLSIGRAIFNRESENR